MKRLLVVPLLLVASQAHAAAAIIILDVWHRGPLWADVALAVVRASLGL